MNTTVSCEKCRKSYEKNDEFKSQTHICYACALTEMTASRAPEEGDFNSASIISGEISDTDLGYLVEDLRAVEEGRSIVEQREVDEDRQDPAWCYTCNKDTAFCACTFCPKCGEYHEHCLCK